MPVSSESPVIVAPTPMPLRPDDSIDHDALARNIDRWSSTPLSGFVVGSSGGEELYLSEAERLQAIRTVAESREPTKCVIGGIDTPSSTEAVRLATRMAEAGADMVRVRIPQTPSGGNRGEVVAYFEHVTSNSPVPVVVIHQTWQTGGVAASPEEIAAVCSLDNVFAYIFWHNIRFESYVKTLLPDSVQFWSPNGSLLLPGVLIGATGACAFFANWSPDIALQIINHGLAAEFGQGQELQRKILRADYLGMEHGVQALKAGLNLIGFEGTVPRRPVQPLGERAVQQLRTAFVEAGILE